MSITISTNFLKSAYEKELEAAIDTQLSGISANASVLSGNITALNDFTSVTISTAVYTLDLTTYRNFTIDNTTTAAATLKITSIPSATDTMLNVNILMKFTATASITYTSSITWSKAIAPNPTAAGTFIITLKSFNAGTNWYGSFTGLY